MRSWIKKSLNRVLDPSNSALRSSITQPGGGTLNLSRVSWDGGSTYWSQFAKANAAGWSNPSFFPIAVFLGKADSGHPASLASIGINTYMAAEYTTDAAVATNLAAMASAGISFIANGPNIYNGDSSTDGWTPARIGSAANVVGWFLCDEPDMGVGGFIGTNDEDGWLAAVQALHSNYGGLGDGRFTFVNFGNGVLNTFWSPTQFSNMVQTVDAACVDKYPYTSPQVRFEYGRSSDWTNLGGTEANSECSAAYGWQSRQMRGHDNPSDRRPLWVFIESKMPFLTETGRDIIRYAEIEGAVWSAITNEARGIAYFQQNGFYPGGPATDPNTGSAPTTETYSLVDGGSGLRSAVSTINSRVAEMAPVINTQSYVWNFSATGIETMLKGKDGYAYIFASVGPAASTGSKTFTLPSDITGTTIDVLYESRTINVSGGQFTDTFSNEYSHHIYKVAI